MSECCGNGMCNASETDKTAAMCSVTCPICKVARKNPDGVVSRWVRAIQDDLCPFCPSYQKVYGVDSHERRPEGASKIL